MVVAPRGKGPDDRPRGERSPNRHNSSVAEIMDLASDGRRVAVIQGSVWPAVGSQVSVHEDDTHVRRGVVARVELVLGYRVPARIHSSLR